ncbi:Fatty-acid amide hydrolase 2 [Toxocara canis]|uniref:Fatty-acid amide hydrolase 2 n=1 Tax=Toxocara canis TaxID=6265 RepID=A0A0B2V4M3_TOXCA|nr:Fatty-acid amide hydrolase 2 [Toxocara canis]
MSHGNFRSSPPEMSKLRALFFLISMCYFTVANLICWAISLLIKKRVVTKADDRLLLMSATEAAEMIRTRKVTSAELIEAYISRIEQVDEAVNAVAERNFADARQKAQEADAILSNIEQGTDEYKKLIAAKPLLGVPFTVKDCIEVAGLRCTVGLASRRHAKATEDAAVIRRMKNAGAILLAVTNVPEVCMWWESSNTIHGRVSNPYDTRRSAGGSSGGEGALVSAAGSVIGLGSDIGGSIRIPSFFNGVFGLKPTPGVVPLAGHIPQVEGYQTEMLRVGPICRYAEDLALLLKVLAADDAINLLQLDKPVNLQRIRVFYMSGLKTPFVEMLSAECHDAMKMAVEHFERKYDLCAIRLDLPFVHKALEFYFASMEVPGVAPPIHMLTELDTDVDCVLEFVKFVCGMSDHTMATIGTAIFENRTLFTEERRRTIVAQRDRLQRELKELLQDDGILLFPSFPTLAPFHNQPLLTPFNFVYTALWNTLALPVVQCPLGLSRHSLPIGVQVIAAPASDRLLLAAARDLEQAFGGWKPLMER